MSASKKPGSAPIPAETRRIVEERANGLCEDCGEERPLELHHLTYTVLSESYQDRDFWGDSIVGIEEPKHLVALCRDCHHARHIGPDGRFYVDPMEMEEEFSAYRWAMEKDD